MKGKQQMGKLEGSMNSLQNPAEYIWWSLTQNGGVTKVRDHQQSRIKLKQGIAKLQESKDGKYLVNEDRWVFFTQIKQILNIPIFLSQFGPPPINEFPGGNQMLNELNGC